jgi:anti-anti-sigma factor
MKPYSAARSGAFVYIRAHGLSNMKTAPVLDAFLRNEVADGANEVFIDLADCSGMDSTFMGTLVGFAQTMRELGGRLVVVNPGGNNMRLLETLGVTTVLPVLESSALDAVDLQLEPLEVNPSQSSSQRMAMIRRAHENLVKLNDGNEIKFRPFLQALQADLDRRQQAEDEAATAESAKGLPAEDVADAPSASPADDDAPAEAADPLDP